MQKVGPEHFGLVSVDCAKARSKWMLADFYGKVLAAPAEVEHQRSALEAAVRRLRAAPPRHDIRDCLVAIERTGRYHHVVKDVFAASGFETRLVHPFTTKQFRQPAHPDNKTDDNDLAAIHLAAVNGFALLEPAPSADWRSLQLLIRHRRSLVHKSSALCCQIRERLDAALPGYAACFDPARSRPAVQGRFLRISFPVARSHSRTPVGPPETGACCPGYKPGNRYPPSGCFRLICQSWRQNVE